MRHTLLWVQVYKHSEYLLCAQVYDMQEFFDYLLLGTLLAVGVVVTVVVLIQARRKRKSMSKGEGS
jgi:hypothetical protein